ncbi:MAG: hypothetical protein KDD53_09050, partial [Bdellovibrionales bacterium]|nr:hypothetical protein [Bdellovibrionales bacterium]
MTNIWLGQMVVADRKSFPPQYYSDGLKYTTDYRKSYELTLANSGPDTLVTVKTGAQILEILGKMFGVDFTTPLEISAKLLDIKAVGNPNPFITGGYIGYFDPNGPGVGGILVGSASGTTQLAPPKMGSGPAGPSMPAGSFTTGGGFTTTSSGTGGGAIDSGTSSSGAGTSASH